MKRRALAILTASASIAALVLAGASPAAAQGLIVVKPGESIQAAVDAASPGTTIIVRRGTYAENVQIMTDRITLRGLGARLVPPADPAPNECSFGEPANDGICAVGQLEFPDPEAPPVVADPVEDVSISGFKIEGFAANGILFLGAEDVAASRNRTIDNTEYGIAAFFVEGVRFAANTTTGSEVAGIYIGDSPNADALVLGNETFDNGLFGLFFRDAADGRVVGNRSHDNCVGAIVLNTGANVAADWRFVGNRITDNDNFCPGDGGPGFSGTGVAIAGASDNRVVGNVIRDNTPSGDVPIAGGVVVIDLGEGGANPPSGNVVTGNVILDNEPDIFWDGSGEGNVFRGNLCETSVPDGLC